jgi:Na+/melibiose symporter-like transporter
VWQDGELHRRWIPPRPADFPGDEHAWFAWVMFGSPPPEPVVPRLTRNQLHREKHPGERLAGSQYGLLWALAALVCAVIFFSLFPQTDGSAGTTRMIAILFAVFVGLWMVLARRHPYLAIALGAAAHASNKRTRARMDAQRAAEHEAYVDAQRHEEMLRAMNPNYRPDYTGPAGFGKY